MKRKIIFILILAILITSYSATAYAYSGSDYTSNSSLAAKIDNLIQGNAAIFSNTSATFMVGSSLNNSTEYKWKNNYYSGYQCYAYGQAAYYYLFGDVPYHGGGGYSNSTVVSGVKGLSALSFDVLANAGVGCGAYIRSTPNSSGEYNGSNGHSMIILTYNSSSITILHGNSNGSGLVAITSYSWDDFNSRQLSGRGRYVSHIVQPNLTARTIRTGITQDAISNVMSRYGLWNGSTPRYWTYDSTVSGASSSWTGSDHSSNSTSSGQWRQYGSEFFGGIQCWGFAEFIGWAATGGTTINDVPYRSSNWEKYYSKEAYLSAGGLQIGDIIHYNGHSVMVYDVLDNGKFKVVEAWGSSGNRINWGWVEGYESRSTLSYFDNNKGGWQYALKYKGNTVIETETYENLEFRNVQYPDPFKINTTQGWYLGSGTVVSDANLTSIRSVLSKADGSWSQDTGEIGISGHSFAVSTRSFDQKVKFSDITSEGNYTWTLIAKDEKNRELSLMIPFYVSASQSTDANHTVSKTYMKYIQAIDPIFQPGELIHLGETGYITPRIYPEDATKKSLNWKSSNQAVLTIDNTGYYETLSAGETDITCYATDGSGVQSQTVRVRVGHSFEWVTIIEPTVMEIGWREYKCTICGYVEKEEQVSSYAGECIHNPDFITPAGLTVIGEEAFSGIAARLVKLSDNVTTIGRDAFADCANLKQIYIPSSVKSIGENAIPNSANIDILGYQNTEAQVYAINHSIHFISLDEYMPEYYILFFDAMGGTCTEKSRRMRNGTEYGTLPIPVREGYTFAGWFYESSCIEEALPTYNITTSRDMVTLYAWWHDDSTPFWIPIDNLPEYGEIINTKIEYSFREWGPYSYTEWSGWGPWSNDPQEITDSNLKQEESATKYRWWAAKCLSCGHNNPYWQINCKSCGSYLGEADTQWVNALAFSDDTSGQQTILDRNSGRYFDGEPYWYEKQSIAYRYRTRELTYSWGAWSDWSDTAVTATETREVNTRIMVQYKISY